MSKDSLRDPSVDSLRTDAAQALEVKRTSLLDMLLWVIAIALIIAATLVNQYLPQYWAPAATNVGYRVGAIVACIVVAMGILYATHQGKGFTRLLKDSRIELKRVTWPTKQDTVTSTWQVLVVILVAALILWIFDSILKVLVEFIIG